MLVPWTAQALRPRQAQQGADRHRGGRRIDEIFANERTILGKTPAERVAVRQALSKPLVTALETFLREKRALLSARSETAKAISYSLNHWTAFTRFLDDGASASATMPPSAP